MILTLDYLTLIERKGFYLFWILLTNLYSSSCNALYWVEAYNITSCKAANCFDLVFKFTSNWIWYPPVSILSTNSLDRAVKYVEHSWTGHSRALYVRLNDNYKNLSKHLSGMSRKSIPFIFFHSFLISEIWQHTYWTLNEFSIESCPT